MAFTPKRWVTLGAAVSSAALLAACGGEGGESGEHAEGGESGEAAIHGEAGETAIGETGEGEHGEGEGGENGAAHIDAMPVEKRLAFMSGHVSAGLALYRAGEPEQAAPHLMHPVSETHASERAGLDALGFQPEIFERVSAALEAGEPASAVEGDLAAAEANLIDMSAQAGGDAADIIAFLMDTTAEEYAIGVTDGVITNLGEYQDAYGFVIVAARLAESLEGPAGEAVQAELELLGGLWPDGPLSTDTPASVSEIVSRISLVQLELSAFR